MRISIMHILLAEQIECIFVILLMYFSSQCQFFQHLPYLHLQISSFYKQYYLILYHSEMDDKVLLGLSIPTASEKLKGLFPIDARGDVIISFKTKKFKLQKAYLRLQSHYFAQAFSSNPKIVQIKQNFQQEDFQNILSLFFGYYIQVDKSKIDAYYQIAHFLRLQSLISQISKDILTNRQSYCVFTIIKLAHLYADQKLFQICHELLQSKEFMQMKNNRFQLYGLDVSLFKLLIKMHKQYKQKTNKGLNYSEVNELIQEYCEINDLGKQKQQQLKFQLFDPNFLTSLQYKSIFLDQAVLSATNETESPTRRGQESSSIQKSTVLDMKLQMQNTFMRKRNEQLNQKNKYLESELQKIKNITNINQDAHYHMEEKLIYLREELLKKQKTDKQQKNIIGKYEQMFNKMQKQLERKAEEINNLTTKFEEMKNLTIGNSQPQETIITQSQFLPAHMINEIMGVYSDKQDQHEKAKKSRKFSEADAKKHQDVKPNEAKVKQINYDELDEEELQQIYQCRIVFDQEPKSIEKKYIPILANLITQNGFNRKHLQLIYRRHSGQQDSVGQKSDIFQKKQLLFLFTTKQGIKVGGFISVPISKTSKSINDHDAFIFSIDRNKKYRVVKSKAQQAVIITETSLVCFSNDLVIAKQCTKDCSYCFWPKIYTEGVVDANANPEQLTGQLQFVLEYCEIYEVNQQQMQMIL